MLRAARAFVCEPLPFQARRGRERRGATLTRGCVQAIEAKEEVDINNETVTLASISYQNFFRAYPKLSGMSGTASTEIDEFSNIYNMSVQVRFSPLSDSAALAGGPCLLMCAWRCAAT